MAFWRCRLLSTKFNKTCLLLLPLSLLLWMFIFWDSSLHFPSEPVYSYKANSIRCYRYNGETLPDIGTVTVRTGKSIFFHETSCNSFIHGKIVINSRQACAVESAALLNPNLDVYLLYTSPGLIRFERSESDRFLEALQSYSNIKIHHLNYGLYTKGTPVEKLYSDGTIEKSKYVLSHASDVLRYLTLWKYGGIYLDLDVVVIKNLESLPPNFSACQSSEIVAAGILAFEPNGTGVGHQLAEECVRDLEHNFSGTVWGNNGPGVVTRLVQKHCRVTAIKDALNKECDNFTVFPPEAFYPIPFQSWRQYFDDKDGTKVYGATNNSYIIHVWNKLSESTKLPLKSKSAYSTFARKFCPKVYAQCDNSF